MTDEITPEQRIHRSKEALRLLREPLLAEALTNVRIDALNHLATVDPKDSDTIMRFQSVVRVTEEIKGQLEAMIAAGDTSNGLSMSEPQAR